MLTAVLVLLSGCVVIVDNDSSDFIDGRSLTGTSWVLDELVSFGRVYVPEVSVYTLTFTTASRLDGMVSCNAYGGLYDLGRTRFQVREMFVTEKACGEDDGLPFLETLVAADRYDRRGDRLIVFTDAGGELHFSRDDGR